MTTMAKRQCSLGYGLMLANWPTPDGYSSINASDRVYMWANYYASPETVNPYYKADYVATTDSLLVEQFRWRG
jgi:hypothetical protein